MPMPLIDITGQVFGRWAVIQRSENKKREPQWLCRCQCGVERIMPSGSLRRGRSIDCGCGRKERASLVHTRHGHKKNGAETSEYKAWRSMRDRCLNVRHRRYEDYGGRGIRVCDRWASFELFIEDMGLKPSRELTLERRNNDGNYEPGNCEWATRKEQTKNRRPTGAYKKTMASGRVVEVRAQSK